MPGAQLCHLILVAVLGGQYWYFLILQMKKPRPIKMR